MIVYFPNNSSWDIWFSASFGAERRERHSNSRFISAPVCIKEGFHHSPALCFFPPPGTPDWPLQNQLAKSHLKSSWVLLSASQDPQVSQSQLKGGSVSLSLSWVRLDQTKSHRYLGAPVQLAPKGLLIKRVFGLNARRSELNIPALGPFAGICFGCSGRKDRAIVQQRLPSPRPLPSPGDQSFTCVIRNWCQNRNCTLTQGLCVCAAGWHQTWQVVGDKGRDTERKKEKWDAKTCRIFWHFQLLPTPRGWTAPQCYVESIWMFIRWLQ